MYALAWTLFVLSLILGVVVGCNSSDDSSFRRKNLLLRFRLVERENREKHIKKLPHSGVYSKCLHYGRSQPDFS